MTPAERYELIDALLEGEISESDFVRLEAELTVDPAVRREYYERVQLSLLLESESIAARTGHPPRHTNWSRRRWRLAFVGMSALAAGLLLALTWGSIGPRDPGLKDSTQNQLVTGPERTEKLASGFAVLSGQADAVWVDGRPRVDGLLVPPGEMHLQSGLVQFELFSGVVLVVEGEARLTIHSPMEVTVVRGKVRARVPEPAHGFSIRTSSGEVVDLGTEFAVNATESGSEVHVITGEVEWKPKGAPARRVNQGEALRRNGSGEEQRFASRSGDFVGPTDFRTRCESLQIDRWKLWQQRNLKTRDDPRLVAYYQMNAEDLARRRVSNFASGRKVAASTGAVVAASPATDRWGKPASALDFSPAGSRVRLSIPGEYRSLTLVCWVRINSLDRWYNSLFLTDGHEQGEPHWQIMDDGRLFFSVKKRDVFDRTKGEMDKHVFYSPPFWSSTLSGQWLMLATTYDVEARTVTHYLNGDELSREAIPTEYLVESVRIGNASLGNWGLPERNEPRFAVRNLNGTIDEFKLYGAALTAPQIRRLYTDGKP